MKKTQKNATIRNGEVRLQRFRPNTKVNMARANPLFGVPAGVERLQIARRFYDELFSRLCVESGLPSAWEPTDFAFSQLRSIGITLYGHISLLPEADDIIRGTIGNNAPSALDAGATAALCAQFIRNNG